MQPAIEWIAEERIRAAYEQGEFSKLPGFGRPLELDELNPNPDGWIRDKLKVEPIVLDRVAAESLLAAGNEV